MDKKIELRQNKPTMQAYNDVVEAYNSCNDPIYQMTKASAETIMKAINDNFYCKKASHYRSILYDSMLAVGMIPVNPETGKPYILRDTANLLANKTNKSVELVRSIGKFYQNVRYMIEDYERPARPTYLTLENLSALKNSAPNDLKWYQMVTELELYARNNNILRQQIGAKITINGKAPDEQCNVFINFLAKKHPVDKEIVYVFENLDYISLNGRTGTAVMVASNVGPVKIRVAALAIKANIGLRGVLRALAREYCHALQEYRDGLNYKDRFDMKLILAAERFSEAEIDAAIEAGLLTLG
ncbi:hypothetical protein [Geomonas ferrireducens]|uniref:hypothetical protein n=1 Tax=Geomonas ferrireducens TaxID=2570227 RepID=UPI0010A7C931|nr:hypothetical protein [Geomonas ferrireducens]